MVLVDIYVPAVDKTYDFRLEESSPVRVIIEEIVEMIGQMERTSVVGNVKSLLLCDRRRELVLPKKATLHECGIYNGSSLLLV